MGRVVKRIGVITLSAALFGGVAAGTFQTVNYAAGHFTYAAAAENNTSDQAALTGGQELQNVTQTATLPAVQTAGGNMDV